MLIAFAVPSFANFNSANGSVTCTGYHLEFKGDVDFTGALWTIQYSFTLHPTSGPDIVVTDTVAIPPGSGFQTFDVTVDKTFATPLANLYTITASSAELFVNGSPDVTVPIVFTSNIVNCSAPPPITGYTVTQGGWGSAPHGGNPGAYLVAHFPNGGVTVGGSEFLHFTTAAAIEAFLPQGGPPSFLTTIQTNPTTSSAGVFAGQVLALKLNVGFFTIGSLVLKGTGTSLDGKTVSQVLAISNAVLGGGALPNGFTYSSLNGIVDQLNESFDGCVEDSWGTTHLGAAPG